MDLFIQYLPMLPIYFHAQPRPAIDYILHQDAHFHPIDIQDTHLHPKDIQDAYLHPKYIKLVFHACIKGCPNQIDSFFKYTRTQYFAVNVQIV
jgi:hypothetical protein